MSEFITDEEFEQLEREVGVSDTEWWVIRRADGELVYSMLTREPMRLHYKLADETRADLDFEDRKNAPHRIERDTDSAKDSRA